MRLVRILVYTTEDKANKAKQTHGADFFADCKLVYGKLVVSMSEHKLKPPREKGVDAQLVADLVFHAAARNANHIVLVANDADFQFAIKRVEDFGCTTELRWFVNPPCSALVDVVDKVSFRDASELKKYFQAQPIEA